MRKVFAVIIALCIIYFFGGWFMVRLGLLPQDDYAMYGGMVGALASVVGLFSFIRPPMSRINLRELEVDQLYSIAAMSEKIQELEQEKAKTEGEIEDLDFRKKEMEILVRKASFSLFLKEQLSYHERRVQEIAKRDSELSRHLEEVEGFKKKLTALNEQIDSDPNVSLLQDIIVEASKHEPSYDQMIASLPTSVQVAHKFLDLVGKLLRS